VRELVEMHGGGIQVKVRWATNDVHRCASLGQQHLHRISCPNDSKASAAQGSARAYLQEALGGCPGRITRAAQRRGSGRSRWTAFEAADPVEQKPVIVFADDNAICASMSSVCSLTLWVIPFGTESWHWRRHATTPRPGADGVIDAGYGRIWITGGPASNPATRTVPVIMLSARAGEEASIDALEAGADDYLTKPFSARELIARVEAQLKMRGYARRRLTGSGSHARDQQGPQFAWRRWSTCEAFCTFDREFHVTYMNRAAMAIAERSGMPHLGKSIWELYPSLIGTVVESNFRKAMDDGFRSS